MNQKFTTDEWLKNKRRRAGTPQGAKLYAQVLWACTPGNKKQPLDGRLSVLIRKMLRERHYKAATAQDTRWLWDATTDSFTEIELLNIADALHVLETQ